MTTLTIDIVKNNTDEVITLLKKLGVEIRESSIDKLDSFTEEDYQKHFIHRAKITRNKVLKYL